MVSIFDIPAEKLGKNVAKTLEEKEEIKAPEWAKFVKTGSHKDKPPINKNWWHIRAASMLRIIQKDGPIGVSKLRSRYGGRKNRGLKPHRFTKASGSVIRKIIQQLEAAGLIQHKKEGVHKGRIITSAGKKLLAEKAKEIQ